MKYIWGSLIVVLLSGCTSLNEGQNDYIRKNISSDDFTYKYEAPNTGIDEQVKTGKSISLHLMHAFIKGFNETSLSGVVRGEIAIVASVFEVEDGKFIKYDVNSSKKQGRLIFYSDDVRNNGHHLNFSYLPIYGPIKYKGGPFVIQFTILELDNAELKGAKNMLKALSVLGQKSYPPSSGVLKVLDTIGSSFLSNESNDREFKYTFYLHPAGGHRKTKYPLLKVGNYALIKSNAEGENGNNFPIIDWNDKCIDDGNGELNKIVQNKTVRSVNEEIKQINSQDISDLNENASEVNKSIKKLKKKIDGVLNTNCTTKNKGVKRFEEATYLTFQINSGFKSVGMNVAEIFADFEGKLISASDDNDFLPALTTALNEVQSEKQLDIAISAAEQVKQICTNYKEECNKSIKKLANALASLYKVIKVSGVDEMVLKANDEQLNRLVDVLIDNSKDVSDNSNFTKYLKIDVINGTALNIKISELRSKMSY